MEKSERKIYDSVYYNRHRKRILKRGRAYYRKFGKQVLAAQRRWYKGAGKEIKKATWLMSQYGLTTDRYHRIFKKQKGCCAICRTKHFDGRWRSPNVDHRGVEVRGILCTLCNVTLGALEDRRPELLKRCKPFWNYVQNPPARGVL